MKPTVDRIRAALAECDACAWRDASAGARTAAAAHNEETGHPVHVSIERFLQYGDAEGRPEGQESLLEHLEDRSAA